MKTINLSHLVRVDDFLDLSFQANILVSISLVAVFHFLPCSPQFSSIMIVLREVQINVLKRFTLCFNKGKLQNESDQRVEDTKHDIELPGNMLQCRGGDHD